MAPRVLVSQGIEALLQRLGIDSLDDVDVLVCNERCGLKGAYHRAFVKRFREHDLACVRRGGKRRHFIDFGRVRATMRKQLLRDSGSQYGATNAQTTADDHACLPGLPDDEVDLLFVAIAEHACIFLSDSEESDAEFWKKGTKA